MEDTALSKYRATAQVKAFDSSSEANHFVHFALSLCIGQVKCYLDPPMSFN